MEPVSNVIAKRSKIRPAFLAIAVDIVLVSLIPTACLVPARAFTNADVSKSAQRVETVVAVNEISATTRRKLVHELSSAYLVFIDKVQADLNLTAEQKEKLDQYLGTLLPDALQMLQRIKELTPREREAYDQNLHAAMAPTLKEVLNENQRTRLSQLERQREGLFGHELYLGDLNVTDAQRSQFMAEVRKTRKKI